MGDALGLLGLARRGGRLAVGEEPSFKEIRAHKAKLLVVASDAADNTARRAQHWADWGKVPLLTLPYRKEELGAALGRSSCALAVLTDAGLAGAVKKKLSDAKEAHV